MSGSLTEKQLKEVDSPNKQTNKIRWQTTPVTREVLAFGIRPFLHTADQQGDQKVEAKSIVAPTHKQKSMPLMGNFVRQECVEYLSAKRDMFVEVESVLPAFSTTDNRSHWQRVIREIKANQGFAIVGLEVPEIGIQIHNLLLSC